MKRTKTEKVTHTPGECRDCRRGCMQTRYTIRLCPLHDATEDLLALLAEGVQRFKDINHSTGREDARAWAQDASAAIAKAEGREDN